MPPANSHRKAAAPPRFLGQYTRFENRIDDLPDEPPDPQARRENSTQQRFWRAAERISGDPDIGLHTGALMPPFRGQVMEYLFLSSPTFGEGLARARPDRTVVSLDGDGSLLMNLGTLATIGDCAPPNLVVFVLDNGLYGTTGGQPTPTSRGADLEAAARSLLGDSVFAIRLD